MLDGYLKVTAKFIYKLYYSIVKIGKSYFEVRVWGVWFIIYVMI